MKKTTLLPILGIAFAATTLLTAFSVKKAFFSTNEITFEEFLQQFPEQQLPYALDEQSLKSRLVQYIDQKGKNRSEENQVMNRRLGWDYYQFLPDLENESSFSRLPLQTEPIAQFTVGTSKAVLYSTSRSYRSGYATYYITVFTSKGEQISSNMVGKVMPESITSAVISQSLQADMQHWNILWKKDYKAHGLKDNAIKGLEYVDGTSLNLLTPTPKSPSRRELLEQKELEQLAPLTPDGAKTR